MWRARARHREGDNGTREGVVGAAHRARDGPWRAGGRRDVRGCVFPVFPSRTERNLAGRVTGRADARAPTRRPLSDPPPPSTLDPLLPPSSESTPPALDRARARSRARASSSSRRVSIARARTPPHPPSPLSSPFVSSSFVECRNPYDYHDPPCKHNTSLWTALSPHPANCAHCVANDGSDACPEGWRGVDCGVCALRRRVPRKNPPLGTTRQTRRVHVLVPRPDPRGDGRAVSVRRRLGRRESLLVRVRRGREDGSLLRLPKGHHLPVPHDRRRERRRRWRWRWGVRVGV